MIPLDRVDSVPVAADDFSAQFQSWLIGLADSFNINVQTLEDNLFAPQYTTSQITALALNDPNGAIYYNTSTNQLQAKVNGVVVVLA